MNYFIENRPRVYNDILDAIEYFFAINPKLAENFLWRIEEAKQKLLNSPKGFVGKNSEARTILLNQFDYHIYYVVEDYKIVILAVLHAQSGDGKIKKI